MNAFASILAKKLASGGICVTENAIYWKPAKVVLSESKDEGTHRNSQVYTNLELCKPPNGLFIQRITIGRAINQYFIQRKIAQTNNATIWLCYDILDKKCLCMKMYHITACKRERAVRFYRDDTQVITFFDKLIDEILLHSYLQECKGVAKIKEVIFNDDDDLIYFIMSYYPSQLMHYDPLLQSYSGPCFDDSTQEPCRRLYKESFAKKIVKQLAETLEFFHSNGIIHKDIKPENILMKYKDPSMFETIPIDDEDSDSLSVYSDEVFEFKLSTQEILDLQSSLEEDVSDSMDIVNFKDYLPDSEFPYHPNITSDFYWCVWEDARLVVDFSSTISDFVANSTSFGIGRNSILYAEEILKECSLSHFPLYDYLVKNSDKIQYKVNSSFLKCTQISGSKFSNDTEEQSDQEQLCVITDFGVACLAEVEDEQLVIFDSEGSLAFTSPESLKYIEGSIPGRERDVFSLGVTLYCMIYGKLPYYGNGGIQMLMSMLETPLSFHTFRQISQELKSLISGMLQINHKNRLSLREVLEHPWINS
ncbi:protein kinase domain-containing protein [Theileria equi strain WA]|uniref:Protein kinase domain-containing protein n=1 Tax=Theileria equi strain WA TaxID=1537102 RepID=L0B0R6_THEEQ|nr:protein kinase domain-containing protein [Theileria equi strain WA]AFZ80734.1 protein kinase domain-containing protein [Theileria equi strain WA]|eukprot:XP_004830400.1 protein kinase domain-containing protein [Theileria equi strain WA]